MVFTCGELMKNLHDCLPEKLRGGHAENVEALQDMLAGALRGGDVVMVKASNGSQLWKLVEALKGGLAASCENNG
jgi:UDP-N-acetylmuramoyl-tripeptide--D-alanyl-D-alanine ligase